MGINKAVARWSIGNLGDPVVLVAVSLVLLVAYGSVTRPVQSVADIVQRGSATATHCGSMT